jgi:alkylation response protein AidB-like acyl-CoA dehydrogenase
MLDELRDWLEANWDPAESLGEWWARLADSGWGYPHFPEEWFGKGDPSLTAPASWAIRDFGAVPAPIALGPTLAAPTLVEHGNDEQRARLLPGMLSGADSYCQLFSEPNAGSDLASLQCRAVRDGDEFVVNGQKVWSSSAHIANKAMLLARTDVEVPKHPGLSYFIIEFDQPGIEVRPIREMTGRALFNEVFLTDVRIPAANLVGGEGNGWKVANTTLFNERSGGGAVGAAQPGLEAGPIAGNLDRPAGQCTEARLEDRTFPPPIRASELAALARAYGRGSDSVLRQDLVRLHARERVVELTMQRARALAERGEAIAGLPQMAKMASSHLIRLSRQVTFDVLGPTGTLFGYQPDDVASLEDLTGVEDLGRLMETALFAAAPPIYGGSDQIQRNILGERVLGLAREPGDDKHIRFKDLPKN